MFNVGTNADSLMPTHTHSLETICLCRLIRDFRTTSNDSVELEVHMCVRAWSHGTQECAVHFYGSRLSWCISEWVEPMWALRTCSFNTTLEANKCTFGRQMHCYEWTYECAHTHIHRYTHTYRCATWYVSMETRKQKHTHIYWKVKNGSKVSWSERLKLFVQMKKKKTTTGKRSSIHICKH